MTSIQLIYFRLSQFIKTFYLQKIALGILKTVLVCGSLYLVFTNIEYHFYLSQFTRALIFWGFILVSILMSLLLILKPFFDYLNHKKRLGQKEAAKLIGQHFPEISDKLLNMLELDEMHHSKQENMLIEASINQKTKQLQLYKFQKAIDWSLNKKWLQWLSIPAFLFLIILLFYPAILSESTHRIIRYDAYFEPKAPFDFVVLNSNLDVVEYEDFKLLATLKGQKLPEKVQVLFDDKIIEMQKDSSGHFFAILPYISKFREFRLTAGGFRSKIYDFNVIPKPILSGMELEVTPPAYTGIKAFNQKDIGDLNIPVGSTVKWKLFTKSIDLVQFHFSNSIFKLTSKTNVFDFKKTIVNETDYKILLLSPNQKSVDSLFFKINLVSDAYPSISVKLFKDSSNRLDYYVGDVSDDYGFSSLFLVIEQELSQGKKEIKKFALPIEKSKNQTFQVLIQKYLNTYPSGSKLQFYFEVADNDFAQGPKKTKSNIYSLNKPTITQQEKQVDAQSDALKSELANAAKEAKELQRKADALRKKMIEKKQMDWNDKQNIDQLINKQKELEAKVEKAQKELKDVFEQKNKLNPQDQEIIEKQKQLAELMEQIKNPKLDEMLQEMQKLMEQMDKKNMMEQLENMDQKSDQLKKELDRMLNLYKNLDYEQKTNEAIDKLEKLSKDQERLSKETEQALPNLDKQNELIKQSESLKEKINALKEMNKELNGSQEKMFQEIQKDLDEAQEDQEDASKELEDKNQKEGAKKQKDAAEKLKDAANKLKDTKKKQKKQQQKEDAATMRRLLQNLIYLSFDQEKVVQNIKSTSVQSPSYVKIAQLQRKIKDDFKLVEDSLYKLASRQTKVKKMVFEEIEKINEQTRKSIYFLAERKSNEALTKAQFAMTSYNNLSLMISESLRKMQEDDDDDSPDSDNSCDNPKKSKKKKPASAKTLSELQKQLNEQLEQLKKQMEEKNKKQDGPPQKPGEGKPGSQGEKGKDGANGMQIGEKGGMSSEQIAKIAAQQAAIRNALKELEKKSNQPDKSGKKPLGNDLGDLIKKMEQTEKDLVNKRFYNEMLQRQKEIEVKLLEAAKAEREQDEEKKRESESSKDIPKPIPPALKKYLEEKKENENAPKKNPVGLTPFYKSLVEKYYQLIK